MDTPVILHGLVYPEPPNPNQEAHKQVIQNVHFRHLIMSVEERLAKNPRDFAEQHLANVRDK